MPQSLIHVSSWVTSPFKREPGPVHLRLLSCCPPGPQGEGNRSQAGNTPLVHWIPLPLKGASHPDTPHKPRRQGSAIIPMEQIENYSMVSADSRGAWQDSRFHLLQPHNVEHCTTDQAHNARFPPST